MTPDQVSKAPVLDNAVMGLRELIASGQVKPGQRLPPQPALCIMLGISPSSLREAVKMLSALGVLEPRHGSGVYVSDLSPDKIIGSLSLSIGLLPLDTTLELYETRRILESHAAAQAAGAGNKELESKLKIVLDAMDTEEDSATWVEYDSRFHDLIAQIAGNESTRAFLRLLRVRNRGYHSFFSGEDGTPMRNLSQQGHHQIYDAIVEGDPLAASNALYHHVLQSERWVRAERPEPQPTRVDGSIAEVDTASNPILAPENEN